MNHEIETDTTHPKANEPWRCSVCSSVFHRIDHYKRHLDTRMSTDSGASKDCILKCSLVVISRQDGQAIQMYLLRVPIQTRVGHYYWAVHDYSKAVNSLLIRITNKGCTTSALEDLRRAQRNRQGHPGAAARWQGQKGMRQLRQTEEVV